MLEGTFEFIDKAGQLTKNPAQRAGWWQHHLMGNEPRGRDSFGIHEDLHRGDKRRPIFHEMFSKTPSPRDGTPGSSLTH